MIEYLKTYLSLKQDERAVTALEYALITYDRQPASGCLSSRESDKVSIKCSRPP